MPYWFTLTVKPFTILCLCLFSLQPAHAKPEPTPTAIKSEIQRLEGSFNDISSEFYESTSSISTDLKQTTDDIDLLLEKANQFNAREQSTRAIQLLYANTEIILSNLDNDEIFSIVELLLNNNAWHMAATLFDKIEEENDQSIIATVQFIFAKYHARRHEWVKVHSLLDEGFVELSEENTAYAYLLNGIALQRLKKHRHAIENYNKVSATSQYFRYAQLNNAIAHIRLGWWTDAQLKIQEQTLQSNKINTDELTNRLHLVLGYALLQKNYYRDARDAFRSIGLDSRYTNRALLGIGLTATSQGDFVGALNALTILRDKKTYDLSVDESYLVIPYVYEKLVQEITVTTAYTEAMKYYNKRMQTLANIAAEHKEFDINNYQVETSHFIIQNHSIDYGSSYPESFVKNFQRLESFYKTTNNADLKNKISNLIEQFDTTFQDIITSLLNERKNYIKSYLNQSRYGLARLYDSSKKVDD